MNTPAKVSEKTVVELQQLHSALKKNPADLSLQGRMMSALGQAKVEQAQGLEIGRGGIKLNGWIAIVAFAAIAAVFVWRVDIPDCIRAWKCDKAQTVEPSE